MRASRFLVFTAAAVLGVTACAAEVPVTTVGPSSGGPVSSVPLPGAEATSSTLSSSAGPPPTTTPPPSTPPTSLESLAAELPDGEDTVVEDVVDGDTIVVAGGTRVRLIGVDTPETKDPRKPVQCFGVQASAHTSSLLAPGTPVRLVYDVERLDRFGRTLAYVYRLGDGLFVNAALVADGFAQVATFPPNVAHVEELNELARSARDDGRGLWSACGDGQAAAQPPPVVPTPSTEDRGGGGGACDRSYPDVCLPASPPDLDCGDISERRFRVLPPDPHRFDGSDDDGLGCEG